MSRPSTMTTLTWRARTRPASPASSAVSPVPRNRSSRRHRNQAASTVSSEQAAHTGFQDDSGSARAMAPLRFWLPE